MERGQFGRELVFLFALLGLLLVYYVFFSGFGRGPVFNLQSVLTPQSTKVCVFDGTIKCFSFKLQEGTSSLSLDVSQNTGELIEVSSLVCTKRRNVTDMPLLDNIIPIPDKERSYVSGGNSGNAVYCTIEDGESVPSDTSEGAAYSGILYMAYRYEYSNETRIATGTISTVYEK